jgi:TetR/AcrR family transcriptional regulator, regulator of biofilm formation and stress response
VTAVSQRVVAQEAGVPPSAVTYYFPTVDSLLVAALAACNDEYLLELDACTRAADPLAALARVIAASTSSLRPDVAAEFELFLLASRRPELAPEAARWTAALDAFLAPHVADPVGRAAASAAVDGLLLRCCHLPEPPDVDEVLAVLRRVVRH